MGIPLNSERFQEHRREKFDEVNAGGIPPKERKHLNAVYFDNKFYVFGSESTFNSGEYHENREKDQNSQQNFLFILDLIQEEWISKEVSEVQIPLLQGDRYCSFEENLFYVDKSINMTVVKRNLETLQGEKHVFGDLKNKPIQDNRILSASQNNLYIYDIDTLYRIENIDQSSINKQQNDIDINQQNKDLQITRLHQGIILTEAKRNEIHLKGFKVFNGFLYSLVQIKNKIALLSISQNDLKDFNTELYFLKDINNLEQSQVDPNQINSRLQQIQTSQQLRQKNQSSLPTGKQTADMILQESMKNKAQFHNQLKKNSSSNSMNNVIQNQNDDQINIMDGDVTIELIDYYNLPSYSDLKFKFENNTEMNCNKQLLSHFSKYFRKHLSAPDLLIVKINDVEVSFSAFQLLIQQFYFQFTNDISTYDYDTIIQLFTLSIKFSIPILQEKCESQITITENNFTQIVPLFSRLQKMSTFSLKEKCIEFMKKNKQFLNGEQMKGLEQSDLILLLSWLNNKQCSHKKKIKIKSELNSNYQYSYPKPVDTKGKTTTTTTHSTTSSQDLQLMNNKVSGESSFTNITTTKNIKGAAETIETITYYKDKNFQGIIKDGYIEIEICQACKMVLNYD